MLTSPHYFRIRIEPSFQIETMDVEKFVFFQAESISHLETLQFLYEKIDAFFSENADPDSVYYLDQEELITLLVSWYGVKGQDPIRFNTVLELFKISSNEAMDLDEEDMQRCGERAMRILALGSVGLSGQGVDQEEGSRSDRSGGKEVKSLASRFPRAVAYTAYKIIHSVNFHVLFQYIVIDARFELLYAKKKEAFLNRKKPKPSAIIQ